MKITIKLSHQLALSTLLVLFLSNCFIVVAQITPAGTQIQNIAKGNFFAFAGGGIRTITSNKVVSAINEVCYASITPNGSVFTPAATKTLTEAGTVSFTYELTNTGNASSDVIVSAIIHRASNFTPREVLIAADLDGDGSFEALLNDEGTLRGLPIDSTVKLQLSLEIPQLTRDLFVYPNLVAKCSSGNFTDDDNVVEVIYNAPIKLGRTDGFVWDDKNGNGIQEDDELGLAGATIHLYDANGNLVTTTQTTATGHYRFEVPTGNYYLEFVAPEGFTGLSPFQQGERRDKDSDVNAAADSSSLLGRSETFEITPDARLDYDAGFSQGTDLELTKQANLAEIEPGQSVTYTITVFNHGPRDVSGARVISTLPTDLVEVTWTCVAGDGSSCSLEGSGNIDDTISLKINDKLVYTITAIVSEDAVVGLILESIAEVILPTGIIDFQLENNSDEANLAIIEPKATINNFIKQATPQDGSKLAVGQELEYSISFSSEELPLTEVTITDMLSEFLAVPTLSIFPEADSLTYDEATRTITATYANLPAQTNVELTINTNIVGQNLHGQNVINEGATVVWSQGSEASNATNHPLEDLADINIIKESESEAVVANNPLSYRIVVTNNGPNNVKDLNVIDDLPELLNEVTWSCVASEGSSCTASGTNDITDTVNILNGGVLTYTIDAILSEEAVIGENLENIARIELPEGILDPNPGDNEDNEVDLISHAGIEDLSKTAQPAAGTALKPGDELSYNISFDVIDSVSVSDVRISDVISEHLELDKITIETFINNQALAPDVLDYDELTGELLVVFNLLPAGTHVEVVITGTVKVYTPADANITNAGATVQWNDISSETSEPVINPVAQVCDLLILPDGDTTSSTDFSNDVVSTPSAEVLLPYTLQNTGNGTNVYDLSTALEELSDFSSNLSIYLDTDIDGIPDGGSVDEISVAAGEIVNLVVVADLPDGGESLSGNVFVNLIGQCSESTSQAISAQDDNNISRIFIPQGGIKELDKKLVTSCPNNDPTSDLCQPLGEDIKLFANADVTYQIRFGVGDRDLTSVEVTDLLDINLIDTQPPLQFSEFLITDAAGNMLDIQPNINYTVFSSAEVAADSGHSGTINWSFENLPAGSQVVLSLRSIVKPESEWIPDADGNVTIDNNACVTFDGIESDHCVSTSEQGLGNFIGLAITKTADPVQVTPGEDLKYTLDVRNPSQADVGDEGVATILEDVELYDPLPKGLSYLPGTATITLPDGNLQDCSQVSCEPTIIALADLVLRPIDYLAAPESEAFQNLSRVVPPEFIAAGLNDVEDFLAEISEEVLFWQLPTLKPDETVIISFDTDVDIETVFDEEFTNHATALAFNSQQVAVAVSADSAAVVPDLEKFANKAIILGTAFIDNDDDGKLSEGDSALEGIRIYLPNGVSVLTDQAGRYTFLDLAAGVTTLKVDPITIPNLYFKQTKNEEAPGFWRLRIYPGVITRQDIAFEPVNAAVSIDKHVTVTRGPVTLEKSFVFKDDMIVVVLLLSSSEPLSNLIIEDVLPQGAELASPPMYSATEAPVKTNGLNLQLGDVPAGFSTKIVYSLITIDEKRPAFTTPSTVWELP